MNEDLRDLVTRRSTEAASAYAIAAALPNSFDATGLRHLEQDTKSQALFGAYLKGKMVGFATYQELNPQALELSWLGVLPEYQGRGIGAKLVLESLEEVAGDYRVCEVKTLSDVHPDPGYRKTRTFYQKLGFVPLETIDPYPGWDPGNPCQIFVKCLNCAWR